MEFHYLSIGHKKNDDVMMRNILISAIAVGMAVPMNGQQPRYLDPDAPMEERVEDALGRMTLHEKIGVLHAQSKFTSAGVPRLGIRQLNMDDGPHGCREELEWNSWNAAGWTNDYVVAFPSLTCLAATWNRDLAALYGRSVSEEFAFRGKDVLLGPGVNIARTPLNGRAFEYMGEDPVLAGEMAVPYINNVQANGVACCLKHFVLNDQEVDRFSVNVNVSERALHEIYLEPFRRAVEKAHVWSVMGSYNLWQNVHCCHNDRLLNDILKRDWNWDGALVSDWGGTTNTGEAVFGGLDIEMGTYTDGKLRESEFTYDDYYLARPFEQMVEEGKVPVSVLDEKVRRVLRLIFRTAMNPRKVVGSQCSEAHYEACRLIAEEGITLLRNEQLKTKDGKGAASLLPLDPATLAGKRILVVGENATRSLTQGGGSSELKTLRDISPLEAIQATYGSVARVDYCQGYASGRAIYDKVDPVETALQQRLHDEAVQAARLADVVIYVGGMNKNHRQDCENGDREGYDLSFGQNQLISDLAAIQPRIVVCTFGGNPYATPWLRQVPALVHCWYLGSEAGTTLVNVLCGKVNPSGKLPVSFARQLDDYPSMRFGTDGYPGTDRQVYYKEDIFVGYRWFDLPKTAQQKLMRSAGAQVTTAAAQPLFPFGFGLSYTTFRYGKATVAATATGWTLSVDITNTGSREGKETVQLYVGRKGDDLRPVKELKNFVKVSLQPGETRRVSIDLQRDDLRRWDEQVHGWQTVPGTYTAYVGASSADIRTSADIRL